MKFITRSVVNGLFKHNGLDRSCAYIENESLSLRHEKKAPIYVPFGVIGPLELKNEFDFIKEILIGTVKLK